MKFAASVALLLSVAAFPALAEDGTISPSTLRTLGLSGIRPLSDEQGMKVRGLSVKAMGVSYANALVIDPVTKSFLFGSDTNAAVSTATKGDSNKPDSGARTLHASLVTIHLVVATPDGIFDGLLRAGSGGSAVARAR